MRIALVAVVASAVALAAPAARADVTYTFTPTAVYADGQPVTDYKPGLFLTFTDAAVASGSAVFDGHQAYEDCFRPPIVNSFACYDNLVAASGFVSSAGGHDGDGLSPYDLSDAAEDPGYGFNLTFNADGTLSGGFTLGDGWGDISAGMHGSEDNWIGSAGDCPSPDSPGSGSVTCFLIGYWQTQDPVSVSAPSSLALLLPALGMLAALPQIKRFL